LPASYAPSATRANPSLTIAPTLTLTSSSLRLPGTITEIARGFGYPDDLALAPEGTIYFSDTANGTINQIAPNGTVTTLAHGIGEPEGIAVLPDGSLIFVEQKKNRLLELRPASGQPATTWLNLENKTGKDGVDNILRDPRTGDLIIPDSPNGRILRVAPDKKISVIATGFVRPTGVAIDRDGSFIIADEFGNAVKRVRANDSIETLGTFSQPDDVAIDADGNIFVASLGESLKMIGAGTRAAVVIANIRGAQGLIVDRDGNLIASEPAQNRIVRIKIR
jgi:sugar lactone lactonase YvrE